MNIEPGIEQLPSGNFRAKVRYRGETISGTTPTLELARQLRDDIKRKIVDGELTPTKGKSALDLGPKFLASRATNRSVDDDESRWDRHCKTAAWARVPVAAVRRSDGVAWLKALKKKRVTYDPKQGGGRSPKLGWQSRKHCLNVARAFFWWCVDQQLIDENPFASIKVEREDGDEDDGYQETWYLDLEEQTRFLAVWDTFQDTRRREKWIVQFAMGTGLRLSEMWCLHLADVHVDVDDPHVIVRFGSWDPVKQRYRSPKGRKGEKKARRVDLFGIGLEAAKRWIEQLHEYAPKNPLGLMFPTERGKRREKAPRSWDAAREAFGVVPRIGERPWWHLLRHTCASSMVSGWWGMRWWLEDVAKVLGHTDVKTTQQYAHLAPSAIAANAARAHIAFVARGTAVTNGHAAATPRRGDHATSRDHGHARRDSNPRPAASKAFEAARFAEDSARHGPVVAAIVHVLRDMREGRYVPSAPIAAGLDLALTEALERAQARATRSA